VGESTEAIYDAQYVRGLFDRMSRSYERMNYVMSFGFSARWRRQLLRLVAADDVPPRAVLDALCGLGETWPHVRRAFPDARLHALDFSPAMLARVLGPGGRYAFIEVTEPPSRLLRALYGFYLERIVPIVGTLLASDPVEYRMLWRYLRDYGDGARSMAAFTAHPGLTTVRRPHFFGCATSFTGQRIAAA